MVLTMSTTSDRLQLYLDAERKILAGQTVRFGERLITYAELGDVQAMITRLQREVAAEQAGNTGGARSRFSQANFGGCTDGDWNRE